MKFIKNIFIIICIFFVQCNKNNQYKTEYFDIKIDNKGYIVSMRNSDNLQEYSLKDSPSPILSLYNTEKNEYYFPINAQLDKDHNIIDLTMSNGSVAKVKIEPKERYFKFTLVDLTNKDDIDAIQWGSYYTNINNLLGEIIGVARDT